MNNKQFLPSISNCICFPKTRHQKILCELLTQFMQNIIASIIINQDHVYSCLVYCYRLILFLPKQLRPFETMSTGNPRSIHPSKIFKFISRLFSIFSKLASQKCHMSPHDSIFTFKLPEHVTAFSKLQTIS